MQPEFIPIKTDKFIPPKFDIYNQLDKWLPELKENDVIFITSKILAIHQGDCIPTNSIKNKDELIKSEADFFLERDLEQEHTILLTIKDNIIIASAGIDESNSNGYYILWPKKLDVLLKEIRCYLCKKYSINNLAIISTDSHTSPLKLGVSGLATGIVGVKPLKDERGAKDIFDRELKITRVDQITPMTSMAVWYMGEGGEQTPICIGRNIEGLEFDEEASTKDFFISPEEDIYKPILKVFYEK
jgi:F420-0:gamma-glutamyl ligase